MKKSIISLFRCPKSKRTLKIVKVQSNTFLATDDNKFSYPVVGNIPRFVSDFNYADNFGMQWNYFSKTQLDSHSGTSISKDRFYNATGWNRKQLKNKLILDAGCGSGRFAEIALKSGAVVVALDFSNAVEACWKNLSHYPNLHVVQGDILSLPFCDNSFDYVYSLGVLQHTPDVEKSFKSLVSVLKPGGNICTDFYWKRFRTLMHSKYVFRPFTKRMKREKLFHILTKIVPKMLFLSKLLSRIPLIGVALKRMVPVANYAGIFPLDEKQLQEWALLDTFDMLAPQFDKPQSRVTIAKWYSEMGLIDIEIFHASHLVGRGIKPSS